MIDICRCMNVKICFLCKIEKILDQFGKNSSNKDGYQIYCKECKNNKSKNYYSSNLKEERKRSREYRQSEHGKNKSEEYYDQNQAKIIEEKHSYYQLNKKIISEKLKKKTRN